MSIESERAAKAAVMCIVALREMVRANPAFRARPCGAPHSAVRLQQEEQIAAEDMALKALAMADGVMTDDGIGGGNRMICDIINPSDPYTLETDDFLLGAAAVGFLGQGKLGLTHHEKQTPLLFGWDLWLTENGIPDLNAYIDMHRLKIASVLDTVLIGSREDRAIFAAAVAHMDAAQKEAFFTTYHDTKRSSMNDIGRRAKQLANYLRKTHALLAAREAREAREA